MAAELVPHEIDRDLMPECLSEDEYYVLNDHFVRQEIKVKEEITLAAQSFEPWINEFARRYAAGETINSLVKPLKKNRADLNRLLDKAPFVRLVHLWQHLNVMMQGPNEIVRKQMLWRIAVDNEKGDPKEATKAIAELNRMEQSARGLNGNSINIIINNEVLPRGALDG